MRSDLVALLMSQLANVHVSFCSLLRLLLAAQNTIFGLSPECAVAAHIVRHAGEGGHVPGQDGGGAGQVHTAGGVCKQRV